ncbi:NAD-dependent epimerase/dehydratase family protein [Glycomyces paridis]|uniref:NAD-dependent epimerase n=1 Tax=Glycomyces paridis TaxID=2126555 RepID=A0A4S8PNZ1_9ACTN|nr:NAD-dependent epimerase/dehydratase family protein [Glycomyces paridis]THV30064.1 NAD-dependent epimerase [Glycomyces paridis]
MRLLVLGGSLFVGRGIVAGALARGWGVTTFNRGRSGTDLPGAEVIHGDRWNRADLERLAASGTWDAVVDVSGYVPQNVLEVASVLEPSAGRYLFISTLSAYRGWPIEALSEESPILECPPDADDTFGEDVKDGPSRYGYQKAGCERAVLKVFGPERSSVLRLGVVLGPEEYVGRLPWWLLRIAEGGRVAAPERPDRSIQPVDVRDVAEFALTALDRGLDGAFNVAGSGEATFGDLLESCVEATGADAELVWTPSEVLTAHGVRQWNELPLWRTTPGTWNVSSAKARAAGLTTRPIADTVHDTWTWMTETGLTKDRLPEEMGIASEKERRILDR